MNGLFVTLIKNTGSGGSKAGKLLFLSYRYICQTFCWGLALIRLRDITEITRVKSELMKCVYLSE